MSREKNSEDAAKSDNRRRQEYYECQMGLIATHKRFAPLEAVVFEYAVINERMSALLYWLGFLNEKRNRLYGRIADLMLPRLCEMEPSHGRWNQGGRKVDSIARKVSLLRCICRLLQNNVRVFEGKYQENLFRFRDRLCKKESDALGNLIGMMDRLQDWCGCRNKIIHASAKDGRVDLSKVKELAEDGHAYCKCINALSKRAKIKCLNLRGLANEFYK